MVSTSGSSTSGSGPENGHTAHSQNGSAPAIEIKNLKFTYPGLDGQPPPGMPPLIEGFSMKLPAGSRCLLIGANGAGKTTLLKIIGGKHMVDSSMVRVLDRSAFHDTTLESSGQLSYLGGEWRRDVAFAGFDVPIQMDISARKMIYGVPADAARRDRLVKVLDIDLDWRLHTVSDGQRRRVQICMGLLKPFKVLLLDEITVDLDVLARADLLTFLMSECEERGATIVYATHIFDGLDKWATHISYVAHGTLQLFEPVEAIPDLKEMSLMRTVEKWLRSDQALMKANRKRQKEEVEKRPAAMLMNNGWAGGRLTSTVALPHSSNRVLR